MRKKTIITVVLLSFLSAAAYSQEEFTTAQKGSMGFMFNIHGLPFEFGAYDDGMRTGVGMKFNLSDKWGLRALVSAEIIAQGSGNPSDYSVTLGAAGEYHFIRGIVSPYIGMLGGVALLSESGQQFYEPHIGFMGGVEMQVFKNLSFYAEYAGLLLLDENGVNFSLGGGTLTGDGGASLGFIVYFK